MVTSLLPEPQAARSDRNPTVENRVSPTVMLVDDDVDVADTLAEALTSQGYEVHVCRDGDTALALADRLVPDAVLLDLGLPKMDGKQVAQLLRANAAYRGVRIIAVTGNMNEVRQGKPSAAGFDHFLLKPFDFDQLIELLPR